MKYRLIPVLAAIAVIVSALFAAVPAGGQGAPVQQAATLQMLDPASIPKYVDPLVIPRAMPRTGKINVKGGKNIEYYEIAVREFDQQILPAFDALGVPTGLGLTTVWSYGSVQYPGTAAQGGSFNYPALTIEAQYNKPVRVKWVNDLVDANGDYLPHLLPVDQTLHWANPPGGEADRDSRGTNQTAYDGPVPIITHVHGAHTLEQSDGYPEAWYLPAANNIPEGYAANGTLFEEFKTKAEASYGQVWEPGTAVFQYPNDQRATTLWYHDHTLGMTRVNVYAGPAGFYLIRGGPDDVVIDSLSGQPAVLPGPAPGPLPKGKGAKNPGGPYYEIPVVIQDRSFNTDGSLFYPDHRYFFEGLDDPENLQIPFIPDIACDGNESDVSKIWQPEFFGNTMVVNGKTWPFLNVDARMYRFRLLNGSNSRFLILTFQNPAVQVWQIGADGGFLAAPVDINTQSGGQLLLGPAERADVIVDFAGVAGDQNVILWNVGPDEPYGGGVPGVDFEPANTTTTGQVMQFRVGPALPPGTDPSTPPAQLVLPPVPPVAAPDNTRQVSLNELMSETVRVVTVDGNITLACDDPGAEYFGPIAAMLGTLTAGNGTPLAWMDAITENPAVGATETWEIYNFTADAHPIHIHLVQFQVVDRQQLEVDAEGVAIQPAVLLPGTVRPPEAGESGFKDTVICYPGEVTRVQARFDIAGLYVWHCHIIEHEDNEMMRPYRVGPMP